MTPKKEMINHLKQMGKGTGTISAFESYFNKALEEQAKEIFEDFVKRSEEYVDLVDMTGQYRIPVKKFNKLKKNMELKNDNN